MSTKQRIFFFLYSNGNIIGSILGIIGLLLFFLGIIKAYWFFIVLALYGIGVLATPRSPTYELQFRSQVSIEEVQTELEELVKKIRKNVSPDIMQKVESIKRSILDMLPYIITANSSAYDIFIIRETALNYLPQALENYLNMPRAFATMHPVRDGKTAKQLLLEQLDLLDQHMQQITIDFHTNNAQGLLVHGRFLEEKFKKPDFLAL